MTLKKFATSSIAACLLSGTIIVSCVNRVNNINHTADAPPAHAEYIGNPPALISEIYSANPDYKDEFGGDPGWVEFYNPADTAVNLGGYCLTDNAAAAPCRWRFGDATAPPRGYVLVFMSGRDYPDLHPPGASIDIMNEAAGTWAWADKQVAPTPGGSSAASYLARNPPVFSGTLTAVDNSQGLGWSSAVATLALKGWDAKTVLDFSRVGRLTLTGFITEDTKLDVRFVHAGVEDHLAWGVTLTGTGVPNEQYEIALPDGAGGFPDLANIHSLRFSNMESFRGEIKFAFRSITAHMRSGNLHAAFTLANKGGSLYLTDTAGRIRDSVAYPAKTLGLSYARDINTLAWAHSRPPTPAAANSVEVYKGGQLPRPALSGVPKSGHYDDPLTFTIPQGDGGAVVACDVTGTLPTTESALRSGASVNVAKTTVMRCAQFMDGAYPSRPAMRTYVIGRLPNLPIVSIAVDPHDMFDSTRGLYSRGPNASDSPPHYGANFWRDTELPVQIEFFESGMKPGWSHPAGLRIFGNYTRMFDKKSVVISFRDIYGAGRLNYPLLPDHPELTRFKHFVLRNNGNNFGYDYIRDMLMTSLTEGLDIDYQRGRPVVVYYNGEYYGIYNLRERAGGDYFETKYGKHLSQERIDLVKAGMGKVSQGSDKDYQEIMRYLGDLEGLSDDDLRELDGRIDIDNFTYNFMCRMYYHDRDWPANNMKRWRSRSPPSRWKFLMYDTDHGWGSHGRHHEPEVSTMAFVTATDGPDHPNPPYSTFLFRKLLENEGYRHSFVNRFSLLMATYFSPERVNARIDALMSPIESEIPYDQERYGLRVRRMNAQMDTIRNFTVTRQPQMQREIEEYFNLGDGVDITLSASGNGKIFVHNMEVINGSATFKSYPSAPMVLRAVPADGSTFESWSDGISEAERVVTVRSGQPMELRAVFR